MRPFIWHMWKAVVCVWTQQERQSAAEDAVTQPNTRTHTNGWRLPASLPPFGHTHTHNLTHAEPTNHTSGPIIYTEPQPGAEGGPSQGEICLETRWLTENSVQPGHMCMCEKINKMKSAEAPQYNKQQLSSLINKLERSWVQAASWQAVRGCKLIICELRDYPSSFILCGEPSSPAESS